MTARTLYLIGCAAPPVCHIDVGVRAAQGAGWDVCLILTPSAHRWAEQDGPGSLEELRRLTGHPVRHRFGLPSQSNGVPPPDAVLVAPLTANTLNKWSAGTCDTLALGVLTEGIGLRLPIVALPHFNTALAAHPPSDAASPPCGRPG
ncbi:flavoprotein [Kitasatospora cheerisanensis]|uniref:Flavoprotein n=1 Tax=Kitasatospora cheerisanensis KCTC 2395 TaxID=1348663 RepID=A0A066Z1J8_9ACTN|nr:flavoprotein [Kitasatospora cheerisanensis]KDN87387.1 flavoprotein [Kitasatospora cheerisanensis KCTC 2395]